VMQAREGRLVVLERDQQPQIVDLKPDQLRTGHLYYQSAAERLEFRLEVDNGAGVVSMESVMALSSGKAPTTEGQPPAVPAQTPATTATAKSNPVAETKADTQEPEKAQEKVQPTRPAARAFVPPPAKPRSAEPARAVLVDPSAAPLAGSANVGAVGLPGAANGIPLPQVKAAAPEPVREVKIGGNLQAPKLIKKVAPIYPPFAKTARVQGRVRFSATIGKDGTIQNPKVITGPPMLVQAATDAVKQWVYQPTLLNGEPTEVVTQIDVDFALGQN
jgi:periplasmic protein TonB